MCAISHFLYTVLFLLLICLHCIYSYPEKSKAKISVQGSIISTSLKNQMLFTVGDTPEIFCSGENADDLRLSTHYEVIYLQKLPTDIVNTTTIRLTVNKTEIPTRIIIYCEDITLGEKHSITLLFDESPSMTNFRCVSKNFVYLQCTWNTTNLLAGFTLNVYDDHDQRIKICEIPVYRVNSDIYDLSCIWDRTRTPKFTPEASIFRFLMEYCNYTSCLNKTYELNHLSIVKLDPPILKLDRVINGPYARFVSVHGRIPEKTSELLDEVSQKVELWSFPNRRESIKSRGITVTKGFVIYVHFPCYGEIYEVRVFVKTKQATEEEYWSDYASVFFKTDTHVYEYGEVCKEREMIMTPEIMLNDLHIFRTKFVEDLSLLKIKLGELKARVDQTNNH